MAFQIDAKKDKRWLAAAVAAQAGTTAPPAPRATKDAAKRQKPAQRGKATGFGVLTEVLGWWPEYDARMRLRFRHPSGKCTDYYDDEQAACNAARELAS